MRKFLALLIGLSMAIIAGFSQAAAPAERPFSPVQEGFVAEAPNVPLWAADRVVVQFTVAGRQRASLPTPGEKSTVPITRTGINSLDLTLDAIDVTNLRVAFPSVADKSLARSLGADRWYILDLAPGADIPAVAKRLASDPNIAEAMPDLVAFPAVVPDDPLHPNNWGHNNTAQLPDLDWGGTYSHTLATTVGTPGFDTNAQAAWNASQGYGSSSVVIAILDSGVDATHPDLVQVPGYDWGDNDSNPDDDSGNPGHGTACAGVAAASANNALGAVGIAGGCSIMPVKVADNAGNMYFSAITNAVYWAADNGADVISMSFGAATTSYSSLDNAFTYAYNQGVIMLAATGNENASQISYPAYNPLVLGVGAASPCGDRKRSSSDPADVNSGINTDPNGYTCDGERWWGSNYGSSTQDHQGAVDIIAPTILPTTDIQGGGGYDGSDYSYFFNGTSAATPYAAGVAALIKSANPGFTPLQIQNQLTATAQDIVNVESGVGWDRYSGYGMVDAAAAVGAVIPPAVQAAFTASDTTGCAPFTVDFTDTSIGNPTEWLWNFGGIGIATTQNPSYTFTDPGVYDVTLSIVAPEGNNTVTKVGYITVGTTPVVSFTAATTFITAGDSVDFTDTSTGAPYAWVWDFGDGGVDSVQNPTHTFNTPGVFSIKLVATNDCGADSLTTANMIIVGLPPAPTAAFSHTPGSGCAPLTVDFTDESTGSPATWAWNFGDGAVDSTASPSHEYTIPGSYDVTLIVANTGGADTLTVAGAVVVDGPPAAAWTVSDTTIAVGAAVTFTDTSTGAPTAWNWDFGDGGTSTDQSPVHQFNTAGIFTVTLIAGNACGADTTAVLDQITVEALAAPVAGFSYTPLAGCAPLEVVFTDESLNDVSSWQWDFGDGGQDTLQNPVYVYNMPGTYDVRLIVAGIGGVDTMTVAGAVDVQLAVSAAFAVSDTLVGQGTDVTFTDASTGSPTSWLWDFGDAGTDTVANPVHAYVADGTYDVTLIVGNSCSADTLTMVAAVTVNGVSGVGDLARVHFGLDQNYPNPFNPSTTFVYSLEKPGHARLEVFDISGRRVATLVDGDKPAGRHEIAWRPTELASGIYFSRLTVGGKTDTKRVTLLK